MDVAFAANTSSPSGAGLAGQWWPWAASAAALVNDTLLLAADAGPYSSTPSSTAAWEDNATAVAVPTVPVRHIGLSLEVVLTVCYAVGIAGNLAALVILVRGGRRAHRNRRHSLMLRCLACNDLVALLGMLLTMQAQLRLLPQDVVRSRPFCGLRVLWRLFGLGSGSVALVMALERWLALTRPFLYQKHITYHVVRRAIFSMWSLVLLLVSLPLFGFGLYYDPQERRCARYPHATKPVDIAYAYVYFTFGMLLIASILCCNLLVVRRLHHAGHASWGRVRARCRSFGAGAGPLSASGCDDGDPQPQRRRWALVRVLLLMRRGRPGVEEAKEAGEQAESHQQPPLIRRFSRNCQSRVRALQHSESLDSATHEETAFAKLMGFLCVLFVLCWLPQMIAIPVTQLWPDWSPGKKFSRLADFSLLLHFTLDPFVYVLQSCTRRHHHKSVTPPAAPRHLPPHAPGGGALGHALAGAAATGAASAWPSPPAAAPDPQRQSYMRKLGSSLRLCGALAMCSCRSRSQGRRRQDGLTSELNSRDLSLLQYHGNSSGITRSHHMPHSVAL